MKLVSKTRHNCSVEDELNQVHIHLRELRIQIKPQLNTSADQTGEASAHHLRETQAEEATLCFQFSPTQEPHLLLRLVSVVSLLEELDSVSRSILSSNTGRERDQRSRDCLLDILSRSPVLDKRVE